MRLIHWFVASAWRSSRWVVCARRRLREVAVFEAFNGWS